MNKPITKDGFTVATYAGDGAILLAFDLAENKTEDFAGFAIHCTAPTKGPYPTRQHWLKNMLSFDKPITKSDDLEKSKHDSNKNPFQYFHWVHFPGAGPGKYTYKAYPTYFKSGKIELGTEISVGVDLNYVSSKTLEIGFTRGYVSSQAYQDKFQNKPLRPKTDSLEFNPAPYEKQYAWLGGHARKMLYEFLLECETNPQICVDMFVYDFDEPGILTILKKIAPRLRIFFDDYKKKEKGKYDGHGVDDSKEMQAKKILEDEGASIATGHFGRFQHNKVIIQKKDGKATKVFTGSANFSVRGFYVQANNTLIIKDSKIAEKYLEAFNVAFSDSSNFRSRPISKQWFAFPGQKKPRYEFSFAPHKKPTFSLDRVADAIDEAGKSVLFAIMTVKGSGDVFTKLKALHSRNDILSLGTIQGKDGLKTFKQHDDNQDVAAFSYLSKNVQEPFRSEISGGPGMVIHHKFLACDFNGKKPVVFCGSSNLAKGGEEENGDNLIAIYDRHAVTCFAIEAIRLYDHYRVRTKHALSTAKKPLGLDKTTDWVDEYYDPDNIKSLRREQMVSTWN